MRCRFRAGPNDFGFVIENSLISAPTKKNPRGSIPEGRTHVGIVASARIPLELYEIDHVHDFGSIRSEVIVI
jgi:hypothetical protein